MYSCMDTLESSSTRLPGGMSPDEAKDEESFIEICITLLLLCTRISPENAWHLIREVHVDIIVYPFLHVPVP